MQEYDAVIFTGAPVGAFPLGAYRLRTEAEKHGYAVKVSDYTWAWTPAKFSALCAKFITARTKLVGFSNNWVDVNWTTPGAEFVRHLRSAHPNVVVVEGGQRPNMTVPNPDWWVKGFSDTAFVLLMNYVCRGARSPSFNLLGRTKVVDSDAFYAVTDYDSLGTRWDLSDRISKDHALPIEIGRGCIFKCAFCHHPFLGKKKGTYTRSVDSIAYEFERNANLFGTHRYQFIDDTFNDSEEKIALVMKARDKAKVDIEFVCYMRAELLVTQPQTIPMLLNLGLRSAHVGIESFNMEGRKAIGKGMDVKRVMTAIEDVRGKSNNRVTFWATFIAGLPGDTYDSVLKQAKWCEEHKDTHLQAWWHYPLNINLKATHLSDIERDPGKFGYSMINDLEWVSSTMDRGTTTSLCDDINKVRHRASMRASGYLRAYGWGAGISDEEMDTTPFMDLSFKDNLAASADAHYERLMYAA
jgi:hypothetical protein